VPSTIVGDAPDMMVLLDASGSMCWHLDRTTRTPRRIYVMASSLTTLTHRFDGRIQWGLMLFPPPGDACGTPPVSLSPAPRQSTEVDRLLAPYRPDEFGGPVTCPIAEPAGTPTFKALDVALAYYESQPVNPVGRYVLLATDGTPGCLSEVEPNGNTIELTVSAIERLRSAGIRTYVLGFGTSLATTMAEEGMMRMAVAGGTEHAFSAGSADDLDGALSEIAAAVVHTSCTVELDGPAREPSLLQVRFDDGPLIGRDSSHAQGWDYDAGSNSVTFYGPQCASIRDGAVLDVQVAFGCEGPLI